MSDLILKMSEDNTGLIFFDLDLDAAALAEGNDLQSAVILSLFTDRLADNDDELPDQTDDKRGWWADVLADNDNIGSRLWLLDREKELPGVIKDAQTYAYEALEWLLEENVASAVVVTASVPRSEWLQLDISITKPTGENQSFSFLWEALNAI